MKDFLLKIYNNEVLSEAEACNALTELTSGASNEAEMAAFISAYNFRRPSVAELRGFRDAMMQVCTPLKLNAADAIDIVGTGGDGKNSFNISTLSAIVVAAAGYKVIKHGSYGASAVCGSSNVLEYLGYKFLSEPAALQQQLDKTGICFLHAPLFHPAMKHVAPVRKNIGMRTFFNLLGPLINPAQPTYQMLGVNSLEAARTYHYLLQQDKKRYVIVHSLDGYDEISLTDGFKSISPEAEQILYPNALGMDSVRPADIDGGYCVHDSAYIFKRVLEGKATAAQTNVVAINSAWAIHCINPQQSLPDCLAQAKKALVSGKAKKVFKQLLK